MGLGRALFHISPRHGVPQLYALSCPTDLPGSAPPSQAMLRGERRHGGVQTRIRASSVVKPHLVSPPVLVRRSEVSQTVLLCRAHSLVEDPLWRVLGQGTSRGAEGPLAAGEGVDPEPQAPHCLACLPPGCWAESGFSGWFVGVKTRIC